VLEALVRCNFRNLTVSIDGASNETYKVYRVNGNFEAVINNIKKINYFKKKYRSKYPHLLWQFVVFGHNERELPKARKLAAKLNMGFRPKLSWDPNFSPVRDENLVREELGLKAASRKEYRKKIGFSYDYGMCHALWENPQINWDGKVLGCKRNFWADFGGNVFQDGLMKAVNNEKMIYSRNMLLGRKKPRDDIPCNTCEVYLGMSKNGQWLKRGYSRLLYLAGRTVFRFAYRSFNLNQLREYGPKIEKFISRR
jgi:MoaA/NifB/PqqE/SkfB family radical SAM enzyme